eukprot:755046-Prymnesium_polylepis.1
MSDVTATSGPRPRLEPHGEVRLEVKDASPDGHIIQKADEADEAVTAGPQGPTYKPKRDRKLTI